MCHFIAVVGFRTLRLQRRVPSQEPYSWVAMPLKRASGDVTKEDTVSVEAALQRLLREEAAEVKRRPQPRAARYRCPMCPFRVLWRSSAREEHDDKHTDENNYVLNMKQLALIKSMFDVDIVQEP